MGVLKNIFIFLKNYVLGLGSTLYLFTLGIFKSKNRSLITFINHYFGLADHVTGTEAFHQTLQTKKEVPSVPLSSVWNGAVHVNLPYPDSQDGNVSALESLVIASITRTQNPLSIFEIGTFNGRTTANIAANSAENAKIITLDLPKSELKNTQYQLSQFEKKYVDKTESGQVFKGTNLASKITQLYGDSGNFDFSPYYSKMDLVFVDASHTYDYVVKDTETALKLISPTGGVILWHDYGVYAWEVTQALNDLFKQKKSLKNLKHIQETTLVMLEVPAQDAKI